MAIAATVQKKWEEKKYDPYYTSATPMANRKFPGKYSRRRHVNVHYAVSGWKSTSAIDTKTRSLPMHTSSLPRGKKKTFSERCQSMLAMHGANWQRGLTVRLRGANLLRKGWVWWHNVGTSLEATLFMCVKPQVTRYEFVFLIQYLRFVRTLQDDLPRTHF